MTRGVVTIDSGVIVFALFVAAILIVAMLGLTGTKTEQRVKQLEFEAVMRGYAEWYSEKEGQQPNKWRWKESGE